MFWFKRWFSEQPPVARMNPWTREQFSGNSLDNDKSALDRTSRLPWFRMERRGVLPALVAAAVVAAGYCAGTLCSLELCGIVVRGAWLLAVILFLVEACSLTEDGTPFRIHTPGFWLAIGFLAYAVFLLAVESGISIFSWEADLSWLTRAILRLVPLLVGGMVFPRQKRWIGAVGAWLLLLSAVAMMTFNAGHRWEFVEPFSDCRIME